MRILASCLCLSLCASLPARADWIVLKNGIRIETKGPWELKGRQVKFTTAKTRLLQALPVADVDLEASRNATGPDPNLPPGLAVESGGPVNLGDEPDLRPKKQLADVPLPTSIRDLARTKLNKQTIEADRKLFGEGGTLSAGVSIVSQLYEYSPHLSNLRARAVSVVGETRVSELEGEFASVESEIYDSCLAVGANPEASEEWYCYAYVLAAGLQGLAELGRPDSYHTDGLKTEEPQGADDADAPPPPPL